MGVVILTPSMERTSMEDLLQFYLQQKDNDTDDVESESDPDEDVEVEDDEADDDEDDSVICEDKEDS